MRRSCIAVLLAFMSYAAPAFAQRRSTNELQSGDQVRVWISGTRTLLQGTITANNAKQLELRLDATAEERQILWPGVARVDQKMGVDRSSKAKGGAKFGALLGGLLGAGLGVAIMADCDVLAPNDSDCTAAAAFLTIAGAGTGAAAGALLGALRGSPKWTQVPLARASQDGGR